MYPTTSSSALPAAHTASPLQYETFHPTILPPSLTLSSSWFSLISLFGLASIVAVNGTKESEKCYSCSSANLNHKWPRTADNKPHYLRDFPLLAFESCDFLRGPIPVVPCPDSVCIKVIIDEPPAARAVCESGPLIVRDCWSRLINPALSGNFSHKPGHSKPVRLVNDSDIDSTVGHIFTCEGFLCNSSPSQFSSILMPSLAVVLTVLRSLFT